MRATEPCGCKHDGLYWLVRCSAHELSDLEESARWAWDRITRNPTTVYTQDHRDLAELHAPLPSPIPSGLASPPPDWLDIP